MAAGAARARADYDYLIKLLLIGDSGTSILANFVPHFSMSSSRFVSEGIISEIGRKAFIHPRRIVRLDMLLGCVPKLSIMETVSLVGLKSASMYSNLV